jgi:general secretion pathway protein I
LVEVLVALMIVALGLAALMVAVGGAARTSGYLRDKTLAQWIALNRLSEVRLSSNKSGLAPPTQSSSQSSDVTEVKFANRSWHYDTRYFDTSIASMRRVVVRVYAGDAKTKGNPLVEATSCMGADLGAPGGSNAADWTQGESLISQQSGQGGTATPTTNPAGTPNPNPNPTRSPPTTPTPVPNGSALP